MSVDLNIFKAKADKAEQISRDIQSQIDIIKKALNIKVDIPVKPVNQSNSNNITPGKYGIFYSIYIVFLY